MPRSARRQVRQAASAPGSRDDDESGPRASGVVYVNGRYVPTAQAAVSVFDHGLLYGDGVFDTMFARHAYIFKLDEHLARLERSLKAIALAIPLTCPDLRDAVLETVSRNALRDAYIKVVATRGVSAEPLMDPRNCIPTVIVFARPYLSLAGGDARERGLTMKLTSLRRVAQDAIDPRVKSLNYLNLVLARIEAFSAGADEALLLDQEGFVCEAPGYNVFAVGGGVVRTPERSILEGITRDTVFELCDELQIEHEIRQITPYDLYTSDEAFLSSTAGGLIPIARVDGRAVGAGRPGPVRAALEALYEDRLRAGWHGTPVPPK